MHALLARRVELALDRRQPQRIRLARDVEDARSLEVGSAVDAPVPAREFRVGGAERVPKLVGRPHEELALVAFRIGVLRGVEAAGGVGHLAQDVVERLLAHAAALRVAER